MHKKKIRYFEDLAVTTTNLLELIVFDVQNYQKILEKPNHSFTEKYKTKFENLWPHQTHTYICKTIHALIQ